MRANKPKKLTSQFAALRRMLSAADHSAPPVAAPPVGAGRRAPVPAPPTASRKTSVTTLDEQDRVLFRQAVKNVQPIKDTQRAILPPLASASSEILRERRQRAVGNEPGKLPQTSDHYAPVKVEQDDASYVQRGYGPDLAKGLKRGKWLIGASVDLHGNTLDEARERLDRFLQSCLAHHIKCVRIVHGKGYGSKDGEPVLKQTVRRWLSQMADVIAYVECAEADGGAGAVQVLLRVER
ncbi:Smr/MutS family protein [Alcaligenaceae bacterium]|nr:Smr/MutS family protein [Alcaligenaceae bacterium]